MIISKTWKGTRKGERENREKIEYSVEKVKRRKQIVSLHDTCVGEVTLYFEGRNVPKVLIERNKSPLSDPLSSLCLSFSFFLSSDSLQRIPQLQKVTKNKVLISNFSVTQKVP